MVLKTMTLQDDEKSLLLPDHTGHDYTQQRRRHHHLTDADTIFWTSIFPSELISHYSADIHKLSWVLHVIRLFLPIFYFLRISWMLRLFNFTFDFGSDVIYPLMVYFSESQNDMQMEESATCGMLLQVFAGAGGEWDVERSPRLMSTMRQTEQSNSIT